ncbi:MAG: carbohydrate kinase family protein, partial [Bacilli bacterium]|nr:carbohydrate kinase family protein [Bacilli bacterium]
MEKIIIAGNLIVDSLKEVDVYPKPTFLGTIKAISRSTGGAVCNVSIDLQKMSEAFQVYALGLIGDDEDGEFVLSALKKNRVDVGMVKKKTGNRTSFTDVINEASGR